MLEVLMVALSSLSLFTSPPTPTTRPCWACLTQNFSKAGDPDLGRGARTNWGGNLPVARCLFLLAGHQEEARVINLCYSDRGCLFAFSRYGPPRDARDTLGDPEAVPEVEGVAAVASSSTPAAHPPTPCTLRLHPPLYTLHPEAVPRGVPEDDVSRAPRASPRCRGSRLGVLRDARSD